MTCGSASCIPYLSAPHPCMEFVDTHSHRTDSCEAAHWEQMQHDRKVSVRSETISRSVMRYSYRFRSVSRTLGGTELSTQGTSGRGTSARGTHCS
jgi:hypothetical protein